MARRAVKPMKAGSFRESVAKTVRLLTRDQVRVIFRGFQPCVATDPKTGKVMYMVLPEVGDNASAELIEAMQGFLDHECGHIFFTPFKRTAELLAGLARGERKLRGALLNIIEDIRLEKLLPRELPGTKDNLERTYDAVMERFWGKPMRELTAKGGDAQQLLNHCMVPGFRALAGQKAFQKFMDDNGYWQHLTPLTSRMPTFSKELQTMETYADVERIVQMILDAMEPTTRQQVEDALAAAPPEDLPMMNTPGDGDPEQEQQQGEGEGESDDEAPEQEQGDSGDAGDDEGNSSEGDEADEGEGGSSNEEDDESADRSEPDETGEGDRSEPDDTGGEGHGDGEGTDDGSDEEGGDCSSDEEGGEDEGSGDADTDADEDGEKGSSDSEKEGKTNRSITDALKELEPTQRKVLYLHKNKKRSVTRIAEKMQLSEDEVKSLLGSARRNLASIMTGR